MKLALGFDGGGTKTECVLIDADRGVLARSRSGPSNPMRVGFGGAMAAICEGASLALQSAGASIDDLAAICAGNAGTGQPEASQRMKTLLSQEFPRALVRICTDIDLTLEAAGDGPVVVLLAGTGSFAAGRDRHGHLARIGGHGPLLSDEGSAYHIGRHAVMKAMRSFEVSHSNSSLGHSILSELGFTSWQELQVRAVAAPDDVFPKLVPIVFAAAESGDTTAQQVLQIAAMELGSLVNDLVERLDLRNEEFLLVKTGGMLNRSPYFDKLIDQRLREAAPKAQFGALSMTPGEAAARIALRLLSTPTDEDKSHGRA
jgi:N-acetylglucosamine kinase-like BadF-type ATPase